MGLICIAVRDRRPTRIDSNYPTRRFRDSDVRPTSDTLESELVGVGEGGGTVGSCEGGDGEEVMVEVGVRAYEARDRASKIKYYIYRKVKLKLN